MSFPATRLSVVERTRSDDEETRRVAWATIIGAYFWEIVIPGTLVGLIVGFATVKYRGPVPQTH